MVDYPRDFLDGYLPLETLGSGGTGFVVKARQLALDRDVVVKFLKPEWRSEPSSRQRFLNEARICALLGHPNLVPVFDVDAEARWIVFGWVGGRSVQSILDRDGKLSPARAVEILMGACAGVEHAHSRGVIHRDLKPDNLLVSVDGVVKVLDFGIASARTQMGRLTGAGTIIGTPAYMSPEQVLGAETTPATDVYGLGATLYDLLTGQPPFVGDDVSSVLRSILSEPPVAPRQVRPELPERLERLLLKALEKDPARRHKSVTSLRRALEQSLNPATAGEVSSFGAAPDAPANDSPGRAPMPTSVRERAVPARAAAPTISLPPSAIAPAAPTAVISVPQYGPGAVLGAAVAVILVSGLAWALTQRGRPLAARASDPMAPMASVTPMTPSSREDRAPKQPQDALQAALARLSTGGVSERQRAARDLATTSGIAARVALCLRLTGGKEPVLQQPVEREPDPAVRTEIIRSLRARHDGAAVLPIIRSLLGESDDAAAAAVDAVRDLGGFGHGIHAPVLIEWSRFERWLRQPLGTPYTWPGGVVDRGTATLQSADYLHAP
ncbi:MAG: serine/threonine protein kinase, partial [Candidatus Wallbacteria bacterium]|nr:serine/threonine protein kinase [Candidatus Wallbacteria bacterium]